MMEAVTATDLASLAQTAKEEQARRTARAAVDQQNRASMTTHHSGLVCGVEDMGDVLASRPPERTHKDKGFALARDLDRQMADMERTKKEQEAAERARDIAARDREIADANRIREQELHTRQAKMRQQREDLERQLHDPRRPSVVYLAGYAPEGDRFTRREGVSVEAVKERRATFRNGLEAQISAQERARAEEKRREAEFAAEQQKLLDTELGRARLAEEDTRMKKMRAEKEALEAQMRSRPPPEPSIGYGPNGDPFTQQEDPRFVATRKRETAKAVMGFLTRQQAEQAARRTEEKAREVAEATAWMDAERAQSQRLESERATRDRSLKVRAREAWDNQMAERRARLASDVAADVTSTGTSLDIGEVRLEEYERCAECHRPLPDGVPPRPTRPHSRQAW